MKGISRLPLLSAIPFFAFFLGNFNEIDERRILSANSPAPCENAELTPKPVIWIGDSLEVLRDFPPPVQDEIGFTLFRAQVGSKHVAAKPLKGFGRGKREKQ